MRPMRRAAGALAVLELAAALAAPLLAPAASAGEIFGGWGIAPRYESTYRVRRRETSWDQTLDVDRKDPHLADLSGKLRVRTSEDEARNNFEESDNTLTLESGRELRLGRLTLNGRARRNWREDIYSLTVRDIDDVQMGAIVPLLKRAQGQVSLNAGGGWLQEREVSENRRGGALTRSQTESSGWQGDLGVSGQWDPSASLHLRGDVGWSGDRQPSETRIEEEEVDSLLAATDKSRALEVRSEGEWSRWTGLKLYLKARFADDYSQFYQSSVQAQETKRTLRSNLSLLMGGEPLRALSYEAEVSTDRNDYRYEIQRSDRLATTDALRLRGQYVLGLPLLRGATVAAGGRVIGSRTARENTAAYDTNEQGLEAEISRPLGRRLDLVGKYEGELVQDFYDDGKLDRDRLRSSVSLGMTYKPSEQVQARGSYTARETETVNIRRQRATQNQINEDYRITADYRALLPYGISLSQSFQISADYTYFVFDEEANRLTRSNRVTSKVSVPLWPDTRVNLEHIYNRSDSGAYVYASSGSEERVYGRASDTLRQYLRAEISYLLAGLLRLRAEEIVDVNSRKDLARDTITRRDKRTFTGEAGFEREIANGLQVSATFARTLSTQEDDYWNIEASLAKTFR